MKTKMKNCKVSIITPCLNSKKTIRQTIESVLNQTYENIEYIIVDGGSTDGTLAVIRKYAPLFQGRLKYVSEKDRGIYDAMNKGIRLSTGWMIGIINSDDWYEPDAVENIVSEWNQSTKYQVIYGYCRVMSYNCGTTVWRGVHEELDRSMIPHPTCFVTRRTYCDFGMFSTHFRIAGDYELMLRYYKSGKVAFRQIKKVIACFRLGGVSNAGKREKKEVALIRFFYGTATFADTMRCLICTM